LTRELGWVTPEYSRNKGRGKTTKKKKKKKKKKKEKKKGIGEHARKASRPYNGRGRGPEMGGHCRTNMLNCGPGKKINRPRSEGWGLPYGALGVRPERKDPKRIAKHTGKERASAVPGGKPMVDHEGKKCQAFGKNQGGDNSGKNEQHVMGLINSTLCKKKVF